MEYAPRTHLAPGWFPRIARAGDLGCQPLNTSETHKKTVTVMSFLPSSYGPVMAPRRTVRTCEPNSLPVLARSRSRSDRYCSARSGSDWYCSLPGRRPIWALHWRAPLLCAGAFGSNVIPRLDIATARRHDHLALPPRPSTPSPPIGDRIRNAGCESQRDRTPDGGVFSLARCDQSDDHRPLVSAHRIDRRRDVDTVGSNHDIALGIFVLQLLFSAAGRNLDDRGSGELGGVVYTAGGQHWLPAIFLLRCADELRKRRRDATSWGDCSS